MGIRRSVLLSASTLLVVPLASEVPSAASVTFDNSARVTICSSCVAAPYPSTIPVSGIATSLANVDLTLKGCSRKYPSNVEVEMVSPSKAEAVVISGGDRSYGVSNTTPALDDEATNALPSGQPYSGSLNLVFPLSAFGGKNPLGLKYHRDPSGYQCRSASAGVSRSTAGFLPRFRLTWDRVSPGGG